MVNKALLDKFDKATDRAVKIALEKCIPLPVSKKVSLVGNFIIEKQQDGDFTIRAKDQSVLYINISSYDIAVIICQRISSGENSVVLKILELDKNYQRYRSEMLHYLSCMRGATKRADYTRMAILEDKFQMSEIMAKKIKKSISFFKKSK